VFAKGGIGLGFNLAKNASVIEAVFSHRIPDSFA
jgi:hypothetical protein